MNDAELFRLQAANGASCGDTRGAPPLTGIRVLLITDRSFSPPVDGSTRIYHAWYDALRACGVELTVISFNPGSSRWSDEAMDRIRKTGTAIYVFELYYGKVHAILHRAGALLHTLLTGSSFQPWWLPTGTKAERRRLAGILSEGQFDVAVVQKIRTMDLLGVGKLIPDGVFKITDLHDNRAKRTLQINKASREIGLRLSLIAFTERLKEFNFASLDRLGRSEIRHLDTSNLICVNSDDELTWLGQNGISKDKLVKVALPSALPTDPVVPGTGRYDFGFIGALNIFNIEALLYFGHQIWPIILARRPSATLLVGGRLAQMASRISPSLLRNTTWLGWIDDVADFYRATKVTIVPLRSGTGVSVKTLEAAAYGAPIVTTSTGIRGLILTPGKDVLIGDDPNGFGQAALALLEEPVRAARLGAAARCAVTLAHAPQRFEAAVAKVIAARIRTYH